VVSPIGFMRRALCLSRSYVKEKGCRKVRIDGYAHHAYTRSAPWVPSAGANEVNIASLARLTTALDKASKAGAIPSRRDIYLTEFGYQSYPDRISGVTLSRQAEYLAIAERMAYANPRVKAFSQYLLRDDDPKKGVPREERYPGFETGLRTASGKKKPAYNGFMLPLAVKRYGSSDVLWGRVRPTLGPTEVTIEHSIDGGKWKRLTALTTAGVYGFRTEYRADHRYRAKWKRADGTVFTGPPIHPY
jgi:hypothetical protein